ncbi:MAG: hypothetical protein UHS41_06850 [Lachnospiraceae bacterium]|nr:hypothetical protein [Lachnospiraceae bacterium]
MKQNSNLPPVDCYETKKNVYDDDNIPEIDLPKTTDATNGIPEEMPAANCHNNKK